MDEIIFARMNPVGLPEGQTPSIIMVMPGGVHEITADHNGQPAKLSVVVNKGTAVALQAALQNHLAAGSKPFFDFNHRESEASAWPQEFYWGHTPQPGVYARLAWTKAGAEAVEGKVFRSFSPAFRVSHLVADASNPARVTGAPVAMGGLVNDPAFKVIAPLWARLGGGQGATKTKGENMNEQELAALKAKLIELENGIGVLKAHQTKQGEDEAEVKARATDLKLKEAEAEAARGKIAATEQQAKIVTLEGEIKARNKTMADEAIKAAIKRGAIPAQDEKVQARYRALIETDPSNVVLVESLAGNAAMGGTITAGKVEITGEDPTAVIRAYTAEQSPLARGIIYAKNLRKLMTTEDGCDHVVRAANTLGTLAAGIVVQRALDLLKLSFPQLSRISSNFSGENAAYGEAITTRLVSVPLVGTYHVDNGYVSQALTTTDVPVTINQHKFVQAEFGANELAGTRRMLFGEQEDAMHFALGKDLVDAIYALMIAGNFTEAPVTEALVDFDRTTVIEIGTAMQTGGRNANTGTRTLLLSSEFYGKLAEDVTIISPIYNAAAPATAVSMGVLPMVHGFLPVEAANLPNTGNMTGFAMRADAIAMAVRPANDYTTALPGLPQTGNVQQITNPDTGLTVTLTQYVNHYLGKTYMRVAWMYGVAKGNPKSGQILRSGA